MARPSGPGAGSIPPGREPGTRSILPRDDPGTRSIPLTGADCFLRAFDHEIRRRNGANHVSQLVLQLGPGLDLDRLRKTVAEATAAQPILRAPIRRGLASPPAYRLDLAPGVPPPPVELHEFDPGDDTSLPELCFRRLNEPMDGRAGRLLRFDVVRRGNRTDFVMSWLHMLLDGSGSEHFVHWLDEVGRGVRPPSDVPADDAPDLPLARGGGAFGARERGERATRWQAAMKALGRQPVRSLAGPLRSVRQDLRYTVDGFDADETQRIVETARERAGFLTPMLYYLAAVLRAHDAVFRMRGARPASYVVPLPVNLRPKGSEGALFRTRVSLIWFQVTRDQVDDRDGLLEELKRQRRDSIKSGLVEGGAIAMDYARWAPQRVYAAMARRGFGGELCSFFFAFTGEFLPDLAEFFGAPVQGGFHAAPVPPSPGSSLALSLHAGRLNATHVYQSGVLTPDEHAHFRRTLRAELSAAGGDG